jgi:hypothetical protein
MQRSKPHERPPAALTTLLLVLGLAWSWTAAPAEARTQKGRTASELSQKQEWGEAPEAPAGDTTPARGLPAGSASRTPEPKLGESETLDRMFPTGPAPVEPDAQAKEIELRIHELGAESHENQKAVERLVVIGKPALPALRAALKADYKFTRVGALQVLGILRDADSAPAILACLQDPAPEVRGEAVRTLGLMRYAPAAERLSALLAGDPSVRVRREVTTALARIRTEAARRGLLAALRDPSAEVRRQAAQELPVFTDAGVVRALLDATRDRDLKTCGFAVRALGEIGDASARPRLQDLTRSQDRFVREEAVAALRSLP